VVKEVRNFKENGLLRSHGKPYFRVWYYGRVEGGTEKERL
jgi:hypothetical protein